MQARKITVNGTAYSIEDNGIIWRHEPAIPAVPPCPACGATDDGSWCSPYCAGGPFGSPAVPARSVVHGITKRSGHGWRIALRCQDRNDGSRSWVGTLGNCAAGWLSGNTATTVLDDDRLRTFRTLAAALS